MRRARIVEPLRTGIRVIDLFTPICAGQRIGVFAGSGVGKSTLLADARGLARLRRRRRSHSSASAAGRCANFSTMRWRPTARFAVAVVATGDESPIMRRLAPRTAMAVAEFFRDRGDSCCSSSIR